MANTSYITIPRDGSHDVDCYTLDTTEEIDAARKALLDAGLESAPIFVCDPDCPDSYKAGNILWAAVAP